MRINRKNRNHLICNNTFTDLIMIFIASACICSIFISFFLFSHIPISENHNLNLDHDRKENHNLNLEKNKNQENSNKSKAQVEIIPLIDDENLSFENRIRNAAEFAFTSFLNHCQNSDEIRPISGQCLNLYGFYSSIVESLESLYLLNLTKLYKTAKSIISQNFKCQSFTQNINHDELMNRGIASLIGTYLVTRDKSFLKLAENCMHLIFEIEQKYYFPRPIINFQTKEGYDREWENGTSIHDIVSGLPEILSLYKITKKQIFLDYSKKLVSKLLKSNKQCIFFDSMTGVNKSDVEMNNNAFKSYFDILNMCDSLKIESINIKQLLSEQFSQTKFYQDQYDPILRIIDEDISYYSRRASTNDNFEFEAKYVRNLLLNNRDKNEITEIFRTIFNKTKSGNGFSGISFSNKNNQRKIDIQPSSFFGDWLNTAAHLLKENSSFWNESVFNVRGHLLSF
ncbi:hypothetical protein TRFO_18538 [Tritrichomonas foetus]|uniref:Alpha-1,2-Mannosidase n=1 Tax=Tritrichomonas foetus TaxID=1144522 RepID=A0A1J4KLN7_9EUKA|nr:hypothetical protein TRFO_18538 [Tritrichomonas foetus]|eukprot:OHT11856.1 hypothetical protein TRFO_18538 [Tritrichomonas foetus]